MENTYTKVGDYLIPDLTLPPEKEHRPIGIWGKRHKRYLMEHKKAKGTHIASQSIVYSKKI